MKLLKHILNSLKVLTLTFHFGSYINYNVFDNLPVFITKLKGGSFKYIHCNKCLLSELLDGIKQRHHLHMNLQQLHELDYPYYRNF